MSYSLSLSLLHDPLEHSIQKHSGYVHDHCTCFILPGDRGIKPLSCIGDGVQTSSSVFGDSDLVGFFGLSEPEVDVVPKAPLDREIWKLPSCCLLDISASLHISQL